MRRADRLFQIVQFLRKRRRAVTARVIAEHFGICERTVYRDIQALMDSGVPVSGAAGVGYLFDKSYELPPVMFDADELEALALGIAMVKNWTDDKFAAKARSALGKIEAVLPDTLQRRMQQLALTSHQSKAQIPWEVSFSDLRDSIYRQLKVQFSYTDEKGRNSTRRIRPLAMSFYGPVWLVCGWCEKRRDFRTFRLDRMQKLQVLDEAFQPEKGKTLEDYRALLRQLYGDEVI